MDRSSLNVQAAMAAVGIMLAWAYIRGNQQTHSPENIIMPQDSLDRRSAWANSKIKRVYYHAGYEDPQQMSRYHANISDNMTERQRYYTAYLSLQEE